MLLVDDSPLVTAALRILLEETGHRVTVAGSVAQAVDAGSASPVDVMLLDLTLPDGDGLSVIELLRARGSEPRVTSALTGHDDPAVRARCFAAGCREVLVKPVPIRDLLTKVRDWSG